MYRNLTKGKRCDVVEAPDDGVLLLPFSAGVAADPMVWKTVSRSVDFNLG